jgi:hypothetical protein
MVLVGFGVDEGGAPKECILTALKQMEKGQGIYLLKEYLVEILQGFLVRAQFFKGLLKEVFLGGDMFRLVISPQHIAKVFWTSASEMNFLALSQCSFFVLSHL